MKDVVVVVVQNLVSDIAPAAYKWGRLLSNHTYFTVVMVIRVLRSRNMVGVLCCTVLCRTAPTGTVTSNIDVAFGTAKSSQNLQKQQHFN